MPECPGQRLNRIAVTERQTGVEFEGRYGMAHGSERPVIYVVWVVPNEDPGPGNNGIARQPGAGQRRYRVAVHSNPFEHAATIF